MERYNQYASKFLFHVKEIKSEKTNRNFSGSIDHEPVDFNFGKIDSPIITKEQLLDDTIAKISKSFNDITYGFSDNIYPSFFKFVGHLSSQPMFSNIASEEFILEETFNWIITTFINKKMDYELIPFLQKRIQEFTFPRIFYFPILNLKIEDSFDIGNTHFMFFTKSFFDEYWDQVKDKRYEKKENEDLFKKYLGRVVIKCNAKAEINKAQDLAFKEACLAMDVFRLFSHAVPFPLKHFKVDLEKRINVNFQNEFIYEEITDEREITINMSAHNQPYFYDRTHQINSINNGLNIFSNFVKYPKIDIFYNILINSISFFSYSLSTTNLHLRITQMLMIAEGILLEEGWVKGMEDKCKSRYCKVLHPFKSVPFDILRRVLSHMYKIRHSFVHKGRKELINVSYLRDFQISLVILLKNLILLKNNKEIKTKSDLVLYIDGIS